MAAGEQRVGYIIPHLELRNSIAKREDSQNGRNWFVQQHTSEDLCRVYKHIAELEIFHINN